MLSNLCPKCNDGVENCWSEKHPQKICDCNGNSCNADGSCCGQSCLTCLEDDPNICSVCKQFIAGSSNQKCVQTCPYAFSEEVIVVI